MALMVFLNRVQFGFGALAELASDTNGMTLWTMPPGRMAGAGRPASQAREARARRLRARKTAGIMPLRPAFRP